MNEWIKWWKDETFMTILAAALIAMAVTFLLAYFIEWGWIFAFPVCGVAGLYIRRKIINKIEEDK